MKIFFTNLWVLSFTLAGGAQAQTEHDVYSNLFPYHIEFSAMTQIKPAHAKAGGPGGHAFLYVHGLCKDYSVSYPKVIPCSEAKFPPGLEHSGVGISVDSDFENTNFVVVPGHQMFFTGLSENPGVVTEAMRAELIEEAVRLRIFEGVQVKPRLARRKLSPLDYQRKLARNAIGTDYAGQWGRHEWGVRFRTGEASMKLIADYLTALNEPYITGKKIYKWSGFYDNCAMLTRNALYQACVRKGIRTRQPWYQQIFNIALPRNGLSTMQTLVHKGGRNLLAQKLNPSKFGIEFETIRSNPVWWKNLHTIGTLPVGLGAISRDYPTFKGDDLYRDNLKVIRMPHKIFGANQFSDHVYDHPAYTSLTENLKYWSEALENVYQESLTHDQSADRMIYQSWLISEIDEAKRVSKVMMAEPCSETFHESGELKK